MTVCRIQRNRAEERVTAMLSGKAAPNVPFSKTPADGESEEGDALPDLDEYARDQIRGFISRNFRGHDLTRLVAAVLRAQDYQMRISPAGPDGGVDIIAGKGALGFDHPKLAVQVKSGDTQADVKVLRELQGVMKNFGAEQGLFVSWGGFKGSVPKEAARLYFEIRLWDAGDLVAMIQEHYNQLPEAIQAELPLKRTWILVSSED
jgi:restriction system protein